MGIKNEEYSLLEKLLAEGVIDQDEFDQVTKKYAKTGLDLSEEESEKLKAMFSAGVVTEEVYKRALGKEAAPPEGKTTKKALKSSESTHIKVIAAVLIGIVLLVVFTVRGSINSAELEPSEIVGEWSIDMENAEDTITFNNNYEVHFSFSNTLQGTWMIQSSVDSNILLTYDMTDGQLERFNKYHEEELGGEKATKDEAIEILLEEYAGRVPPKGIYHLVRTEQHLVFTEDESITFSSY